MGERLGIPGAVIFCPCLLPPFPACLPAPLAHQAPAHTPTSSEPRHTTSTLPPAPLPTCFGLPSFPSHTPPMPHATQGPSATAACNGAHPEAPHTLASTPARPTLHSHLPHTHTQPPSQPLLPSTHTLTHATPPSALGPQPPWPPAHTHTHTHTRNRAPPGHTAPAASLQQHQQHQQQHHLASPGSPLRRARLHAHSVVLCQAWGETCLHATCHSPPEGPPHPPTHPPTRPATLRWAPSPGPRRHTPTADTRRSSPARGCRGCPGAPLWRGQTCPVDRSLWVV